MPHVGVALIFMNCGGFGLSRGGDSDISCENYEKIFTVIPTRFQKTSGNQAPTRSEIMESLAGREEFTAELRGACLTYPQASRRTNTPCVTRRTSEIRLDFRDLQIKRIDPERTLESLEAIWPSSCCYCLLEHGQKFLFDDGRHPGGSNSRSGVARERTAHYRSGRRSWKRNHRRTRECQVHDQLRGRAPWRRADDQFRRLYSSHPGPRHQRLFSEQCCSLLEPLRHSAFFR